MLKFETMNGQTKIYQDKIDHGEEDLAQSSSGSDDEEEDDIAKTKKTLGHQPTTVSIRVPNEKIKNHVTAVFKRNKKLMKLLYEGQKSELLFIEAVLVPPSKFRPMNVVGGAVSASIRTVALKNIVSVNEKIKWLQTYMADLEDPDAEKLQDGEQAKVDVYLGGMPGSSLNEKYDLLECELQTRVNIMIDSNRERQVRDKDPGAKQRLEKKSGLFRMNIMGEFLFDSFSQKESLTVCVREF